MKIEIEDSTYTVRTDGYGLREESYNEGRGRQITGIIETPSGYVRCYSNDYTNDHTGKRYRSSSLRFIHDSKEHWRRFAGIAYTRRGLVTKARQFVAEITNS